MKMRLRLHTQFGLLSYSKSGIIVFLILLFSADITGIKITSLAGVILSITILLIDSWLLTKGDNLPFWRKAVWFTVCLIPFTELFFFTGILNRLRISSRLGGKIYGVFYTLQDLQDEDLLPKETDENASYDRSDD